MGKLSSIVKALRKKAIKKGKKLGYSSNDVANMLNKHKNLD